MQINKSEGHMCFYIEGCCLYEVTYNMIYFISEILWPDTDFLNDAEMEAIENILNGIE